MYVAYTRPKKKKRERRYESYDSTDMPPTHQIPMPIREKETICTVSLMQIRFDPWLVTVERSEKEKKKKRKREEKSQIVYGDFLNSYIQIPATAKKKNTNGYIFPLSEMPISSQYYDQTDT